MDAIRSTIIPLRKRMCFAYESRVNTPALPASLAACFASACASHMKAGDGNRTHVSSLEGWCSTIELHPRIYKALSRSFMHNAQNRNRTSDTRIFSPLLYQLSYLGLQPKSSYGKSVDFRHNIGYFTWYHSKCQGGFLLFLKKIFPGP